MDGCANEAAAPGKPKAHFNTSLDGSRLTLAKRRLSTPLPQPVQELSPISNGAARFSHMPVVAAALPMILPVSHSDSERRSAPARAAPCCFMSPTSSALTISFGQHLAHDTNRWSACCAGRIVAHCAVLFVEDLGRKSAAGQESRASEQNKNR